MTERKKNFILWWMAIGVGTVSLFFNPGGVLSLVLAVICIVILIMKTAGRVMWAPILWGFAAIAGFFAAWTIPAETPSLPYYYSVFLPKEILYTWALNRINRFPKPEVVAYWIYNGVHVLLVVETVTLMFTGIVMAYAQRNGWVPKHMNPAD